ncbi:MAG: nucleotide exchange factor GrpE [Erysipelotrichaceae bacterium]|nr:nucleotide exchange factor GrpE [Erysipelotrichaceae bacterium]
MTTEKEILNETVEEAAEEVVEETVENEEPKKKKKLFEKKENTEELKTRISELEGECARLKNEYLKAYADTENTRRRLQNDFESRQKYRIQSFALDILPAIDNLERALAQKATPENESYYKGVEMIYNQLVYALSKEGVEVIDSLNQPFDAAWHQAVMTSEAEGVEPGTVIEVFQKGYKLKDRLLRPAMVKVSE